MNIKSFMGIASKCFLDVLLPLVDVGSDVYFTWDVYNKGEMKFFTTSGIFFKDIRTNLALNILILNMQRALYFKVLGLGWISG